MCDRVDLVLAPYRVDAMPGSRIQAREALCSVCGKRWREAGVDADLDRRLVDRAARSDCKVPKPRGSAADNYEPTPVNATAADYTPNPSATISIHIGHGATRLRPNGDEWNPAGYDIEKAGPG